MDRSTLVYEWTERLFPHAKQPRLTFKQADAILSHVWSLFGQGEKPKLVDGYYARTNGVQIELPYQARTVPILLHEIAHAIILDKDSDDHGPAFVDLVIEIYATCLPRTKEEMKELAETMGL